MLNLATKIPNASTTAHPQQMTVQFYKIRTGQIEKDIKHDDIQLGFGDHKFVYFNRLLTREADMSELSKISFRRILENLEDFDIFETYLRNGADTPFYIFCRKENFNLYQNSLAAYTRRVDKEAMSTYLWTHFYSNDLAEDLESLKWKRTTHNFWWDVNHDWMGFFGAQDRINAFRQAMKNEHEEYLTSKDEPTYK